MALKLACAVLLAIVALASCPAPSASRLLRAGSERSNSAPAPAPAPANLWQLISNSTGSGDLSTLKLLVQSAGLAEQLNDTTTAATMFLPNNDAWSSYMTETGRNLTQLMQLPSLAAQLRYHLHLGSNLTMDDLQPGMSTTMADGNNITGDISYDDAVELRDAAGRTSKVLIQNLVAGPNATAHIVSRVLVPRRPQTLEQALLSNTQFSSFLKVLYVGGFNATLNSTNANMTFFVPTNDAFSRALATLNLTFSALLENRTLVTSIGSAHTLPNVQSWESLLALSGQQYFFSCSTCAAFFTSTLDNGQVGLTGVGSVATSTAVIEEDNLVAGQFALAHTLNSVLLPVVKWGSHCTNRCQSPSDLPPPQRRALIHAQLPPFSSIVKAAQH